MAWVLTHQHPGPESTGALLTWFAAAPVSVACSCTWQDSVIAGQTGGSLCTSVHSDFLCFWDSWLVYFFLLNGPHFLVSMFALGFFVVETGHLNLEFDVVTLEVQFTLFPRVCCLLLLLHLKEIL